MTDFELLKYIYLGIESHFRKVSSLSKFLLALLLLYKNSKKYKTDLLQVINFTWLDLWTIHKIRLPTLILGFIFNLLVSSS